MKNLFTTIIIFIIYLWLIISSKYFWLNFVFFNTLPANNTWSITTNSWVVNTWSEIVSTWSFSRDDYLNILNWTWLKTAEEKVNYALAFWSEWLDFITVTPHEQNLTLWATKSINNVMLLSFIQKYQYNFILDKKRDWYLVVRTKKRIPANKDMLLWINWKSLWAFHKSEWWLKFMSDISDNKDDTTYIFKLNNIDIAQYKQRIDLNSYSPLNVSIAIWENNNSVTEISVVYIN